MIMADKIRPVVGWGVWQGRSLGGNGDVLGRPAGKGAKRKEKKDVSRLAGDGVGFVSSTTRKAWGDEGAARRSNQGTYFSQSGPVHSQVRSPSRNKVTKVPTANALWVTARRARRGVQPPSPGALHPAREGSSQVSHRLPGYTVGPWTAASVENATSG